MATTIAEISAQIVKSKTTFLYINGRIYKYTQLVEKITGDIYIDEVQSGASENENSQQERNLIIDLTDDGVIDLTSETENDGSEK